MFHLKTVQLVAEDILPDYEVVSSNSGVKMDVMTLLSSIATSSSVQVVVLTDQEVDRLAPLEH